jgi:hypothetical protein
LDDDQSSMDKSFFNDAFGVLTQPDLDRMVSDMPRYKKEGFYRFNNDI